MGDETLSGLVTMTTATVRATGVWLLINRRRRAFVPRTTPLVKVGDWVEVRGRWSSGAEHDFLLAHDLRVVPDAPLLCGPALERALFGKSGRPDMGLMAIELIGPLLAWLHGAGWKKMSKELAASSTKSLQAIYHDIFVLYRLRRLPFEVCVCLHRLMGRTEVTQGAVRAAAAEVLKRADEDGIGGLETSLVLRQAAQILGVPVEAIGTAQDILVASVAQEADGVCYSPTLFFHRQKALAAIRSNQMQMEDCPEEQVRAVLKWRYAVVTGPAGSGKTQMLLRLADVCRTRGVSVAMTALTGKAAALLGPDGQTLHRLLGYGGGGFSVETLPYGVVFVDEVSMLVWPLLNRLLQVATGQVVFCGDPRQLPPVGGVPVMKELLTRLPVLELPSLCPGTQGERVRVTTVKCWSHQHLVNSLERFVRDCQLRGVEWQVLSPVHGGQLGTRALNRSLQNLVNSHGAPVEAPIRLGDRVIVKENSYRERSPVFNGDMGKVIGSVDGQVLVELDAGRCVRLPYSGIDLAYCLTVHKVQGSRYDTVFFVVPETDCGEFVQDSRLRYVGLTRGRRKTVCLVF